MESGLKPDIVTGDFDSIGEVPTHPDFKVVPAPEQDATDFEKALRHLPRETQSVVILGGTGLRSDHFLTNLLIAAGLPAELRVAFQDDLQSIHRVTPRFSLEIDIPHGTIVSLIPFSECNKVSSKGLLWNLDNTQMGPGAQLSQSNQAAADHISVSIGTGTLYLVVNHPDGAA
jgi:thiamine pyrophosphokinase